MNTTPQSTPPLHSVPDDPLGPETDEMVSGNDGQDEQIVENDPSQWAQPERRLNIRAFEYWEELLDGREFPSVTDLEPEDIESFREYSVLVDFTAGYDAPILRYVGRHLRDECGLPPGDIEPGAVPARSMLSRLTDHYLEILANRAPIGFEAEFENSRGFLARYRGILMPLSDDGETINFVYGVLNWREDPLTSDHEGYNKSTPVDETKFLADEDDSNMREENLSAEADTEVDELLTQDELIDAEGELDDLIADFESQLSEAEASIDQSSSPEESLTSETGSEAIADTESASEDISVDVSEPLDLTQDDVISDIDALLDNEEFAQDEALEAASNRSQSDDDILDLDESYLADPGESVIEKMGSDTNTPQTPEAMLSALESAVRDLVPGAHEAVNETEPEISEPAETDHSDPVTLGQDLIETETPESGADFDHEPVGRVASLRDRLNVCQQAASQLANVDSRTRATLYQTLDRAYAFAEAADENPEDFEALLAENQIVPQERAPLTPVVKLVFGADYDKTRLTEYAATLSYARRENVPSEDFGGFLERFEGGIKGIVKAERAAKRAQKGNAIADKLGEAKARLATRPSLADVVLPDTVDAGDEEFVMILARKSGDGRTVSLIDVVEQSPSTLNAALKRAAKQKRKGS
ncbi:MAG: hypothetical protein AAGF15_00670 [Pseudomonadota bacterium]